MDTHERDKVWAEALGLPRVMTPAEAKEWLEAEARKNRAEIVDATRYKGSPKWY